MFSVPFATPNILPLEQTRKSMQKAEEMVYLQTPRLCTSPAMKLCPSRVHLTSNTSSWISVASIYLVVRGSKIPRTSKNLQEPPRSKGTKLDPKSPAPHRLRRELARLGQENQLLRYRIASVVGVPNFWATHGGHEVRIFFFQTEVFQSFRSYRAYSIVSIVSTIVYPIPFSHIHIIFSIRTRVSFRC